MHMKVYKIIVNILEFFKIRISGPKSKRLKLNCHK